MGKEMDVTQFVYSPQEVSTMTTKLVDERRNDTHGGVPLYIDSIDQDYRPGRPGDLVGIMGRPGNGKTSLMKYALAKDVEYIVAQKLEKTVDLYVTWETTVEESGLFDLARGALIDADKIAQGRLTDAEWKKVMGAALDRASHPLWVIGYSIERDNWDVELPLSAVERAIRYIIEVMGFKVRLIALDYLQMMPPERHGGYEQRREWMTENVYKSKDLGRKAKATTYLGIQAKRDVDKYPFPMPGLSDGFETSAIEHAMDKLIAIMLPSNYGLVGELIEPVGMVGLEDMAILSIGKQRFGKANKLYPVRFTKAQNLFASYETRNVTEELHRADFPVEIGAQYEQHAFTQAIP